MFKGGSGARVSTQSLGEDAVEAFNKLTAESYLSDVPAILLANPKQPQVAAAADRHYRLVKGTADDGRAVTTIEPVEGDELVAEMCRMLGASADDEGARAHAAELLARRGR